MFSRSSFWPPTLGSNFVVSLKSGRTLISFSM
uniref:Uncharacterized protein n=1 Tax=Anguilla anguilla TaxID=7936 RepID=A0A0E9QLT4_ANGAN